MRTTGMRSRAVMGLAVVAAAVLAYVGFRMSESSGGKDGKNGYVSQGGAASGDKLLRKAHARGRREQRIRPVDVKRRHGNDELKAVAEEARRERLESRADSELISEIADMIQQDFTEDERRYLTTLRDALNSEDNKQIIAVARLAVKSNNSEIKERAISALGWVGEEALPELTEFLMDDDEEIVQAAIDKWEEAIRECENEADVINNTMLGMMAIKDEAACDYLSMNLIKSGEATLAVEAIVNLMACDNEACHRPAKEAYEWITDKEWTGAADAKAWIAAHPDL